MNKPARARFKIDSAVDPHFTIVAERHGLAWLIICPRCRAAWRLRKDSVHAGHKLRLHQHALDCERRSDNPHSPTAAAPAVIA